MLQGFSLLSSVPTLVHPDPSTKVSLAVDSSGSQVGAVLQQEVAGFWAPLAFYSISSAKTRYSAFDRNCLLLIQPSAISGSF